MAGAGHRCSGDVSLAAKKPSSGPGCELYVPGTQAKIIPKAAKSAADVPGLSRVRRLARKELRREPREAHADSEGLEGGLHSSDDFCWVLGFTKETVGVEVSHSRHRFSMLSMLSMLASPQGGCDGPGRLSCHWREGGGAEERHPSLEGPHRSDCH